MASLRDDRSLADDADSIVSSVAQDSLSITASEPASEDDETQGTDPESTSAQQAQKAIEAAEASSTRSPSLALSSRSASLAPSSIWNHLPPRRLRGRSPGPPGYAEAIASQSAFLQEPADEAQAPLYADDDEVSVVHLLNDTQKHRFSSFFKRYWRIVVLINVAIYCLIITATLVFHLVTRQKTMAISAAPSWARPDRYHTNTSECQFTHYKYHYFSHGEGDQLRFRETLPTFIDRGKHALRISGKVEIRPAPFNQGVPVYAIVSVATTRQWSAGSLDIAPLKDGLQIGFPAFPRVPLRAHRDLRRRGDYHRVDCLDVWVGFYVKGLPDVLEMQTDSMHIGIGAPVDSTRALTKLHASDTRIQSRTGDIRTGNLKSQHARVSSDSGSILGAYTVGDELHVETKTGYIGVEIMRDTNLQQNANPGCHASPPANVSTRSFSGRQDVFLDQPPNIQRTSPGTGNLCTTRMNSHHSSDLGSINLTTNRFWEGAIEADTENGSIYINGTHLIGGSHPSPPDMKHQRAKVGAENSTMKLETGQGDISILLQDFYVEPLWK